MMMKGPGTMLKILGGVLFVLWASLQLAGAAPGFGPVVVDRVVAVVNNEIITMSDLQRESLKRPETTDQRLILESMIDRKLQMVAAKRNGMEVTDGELAEAVADIMKRNNMDSKQFDDALAREGLTLEQYRAEFREQMTMSRLFNKFIRSNVSMEEKELREHYEQNVKQFSLPEEVRVRLLVVTVPEKASIGQVVEARQKAEALMVRIGKGEDFIRLIREHSGSPTAAQDGDLGFMQRDHAIPEIEEATKDLKPGQYAGPLKASDGFYIIRLEEIRTPVRPFEKVKDEIYKTLYEQKMENAYRAFLQTLRSEAHIENRL
jgi:peptidyl-prolyl cis-trans isomerase SurA